MPIDPNIPLSFKPTVALQQRDPLADFARLQGIQANQQTMQMNQQKMAQLQQDRQEMLALQQKMVELSGSGDLKGMFTAMAGSRDPQERIKGMAGLQKIQEQEDYRNFVSSNTPATTTVGPEAKQAWQEATSSGKILPPLSPFTPANALAPQTAAPVASVNALTQPTSPVVADEAKIQQALLSPNPRIQKWGEVQQQRLNTVMTRNAPSASQKDYQFAQSQGYKGSFTQWRQDLARAGAINMPAEKYPPVAVVNPVTGNVEYVSRKEALETRAAPATEQVVLPAKEKRKREATWPTANANIKAIEANAAEDAKRLRDLANHPGLSGITGLVAGRTPNFTGDARQAQALYDQITAKGGFKMLQDMREASKTGGALGNVSDREGQRLEAAYGAINQTQDTEDVRQALLDLADKAEASAVRARDAFDETYLYRTEKPGAAAPTAQGGANTVTLPDGQVMSFPDAASAAAFKKAAGL